MDNGRRHETPRTETKDCVTYGTINSISISMLYINSSPEFHMGNGEGPDRCSPGGGIVPQLKNTELEEPTICSKQGARLLFYIEGDRTPSFKVAHCEFNPEK